MTSECTLPALSTHTEGWSFAYACRGSSELHAALTDTIHVSMCLFPSRIKELLPFNFEFKKNDCIKSGMDLILFAC